MNLRRRWPRQWALVVASVVLLGAVETARANPRGVAVEGYDRTRVLPPVGAEVVDYTNAGYRLRVADGEVAIDVSMGPIESNAEFQPPQERLLTPSARLAYALTVGAPTEYQAVSKILGWVARNIAYDLDRTQGQDADAVLERRSGYCTGIARLTVALIQAVGIPAREVAGYLVEDGLPETGSVGGFHRWIEVYYEDRGWMFSDPLATHHYVPASYVRLASDRLRPEDGTTGLLIERRDDREVVDVYPEAAVGVSARRNWARQRAAVLKVQVEEHESGTVVLEGALRRRVHALRQGSVTFVGLDPGPYTVRLLLPGRVPVERQVDLGDRARAALLLPQPPPVRAQRPHRSAIDLLDRGLLTP